MDVAVEEIGHHPGAMDDKIGSSCAFFPLKKDIAFRFMRLEN